MAIEARKPATALASPRTRSTSGARGSGRLESPVALAVPDGWISTPDDLAGMARMGIKYEGGGPHQSKTMMLAELTIFLSAGTDDPAVELVVQENLLGKPSVRAREAALLRLRQLYGFGNDCPICKTMRLLWERDPAGRPLRYGEAGAQVAVDVEVFRV